MSMLLLPRFADSDLKTGDILTGNTRVKTQGEKFSALLYVSTINGHAPGRGT